jgi:hypothetical protein
VPDRAAPASLRKSVQPSVPLDLSMMARPQPIAERRSALAQPRSMVVRHFTAAVRIAADHHISRSAARVAVAHRMVAEHRIS